MADRNQPAGKANRGSENTHPRTTQGYATRKFKVTQRLDHPPELVPEPRLRQNEQLDFFRALIVPGTPQGVPDWNIRQIKKGSPFIAFYIFKPSLFIQRNFLRNGL
jgi:hypothetical protein